MKKTLPSVLKLTAFFNLLPVYHCVIQKYVLRNKYNIHSTQYLYRIRKCHKELHTHKEKMYAEFWWENLLGSGELVDKGGDGRTTLSRP
jgi:hypothetical protein